MMTRIDNIETRTILTFNDGENETEMSYRGLLNLQEGDIINLTRTMEEMPVKPGNYIIRRDNIPNQMSLSFDNDKPDSIYRYFNLEILP